MADKDKDDEGAGSGKPKPVEKEVPDPITGLYKDGSKDGLNEEEKQGGEFIPRDRFNEKNDELKEAQLQLKKLELENKERKDKENLEERKRLENDENFKELYLLEKTKNTQLEGDLNHASLSTLRMEVGREAGLPDEISKRLVGETKAELALDALKVREHLPKKSSHADGGQGGGRPLALQTNPTNNEDTVVAKKRANSMYNEL